MSESKFKTMRHIETVRNYINCIIVVVTHEVYNMFHDIPVVKGEKTLVDDLILKNTVYDEKNNWIIYFDKMIGELLNRAQQHDQSKLQPPEVDIFDEYTPKLRDITYGSEEYKQCLKEMQPALDHHYANNRHHPEWHKNGFADMTIIDQIEWICDCKSATLRHADGCIMKSLEINQKRFGYSDELKQVFINTAKMLNEADVYHKANES